MSVWFIRLVANGIITVFCLWMVASRLASFPTSGYHLLWGLAALFILVLDIYFLTKSFMQEPKGVDTSLTSFFYGVSGSLGFGLSAVVVSYPPLNLDYLQSMRAIGGGFAVLPYPFIIWALLCLKNCLTVIPEAHDVVAHGIYKYSRHPLYVSYIIWALANMLMFPSLPMWALSLAHIGVLIARLKREEKLLLATFPEYRDYYCRTGLVGTWRFKCLLGE